MAILKLCVFLACCVACGLGGGGSELKVESFPQSGLGPFRLLLPEEAPDLQAPYLFLPPGIDVEEPSALVDEKGEGLRLFVTARRRGQGQPPFLARAEVPRLEAGAGDLTPVLANTVPWEGGVLRQPTIIDLGIDLGIEGGAGKAHGLDRLLLFYQGADGSLGLVSGESEGDLRRRTVTAPLLPAAALPPGERLVSASLVLLPAEEGAPARLRAYLLAAGARGERLLRADLPLPALRAALDPGQDRPGSAPFQLDSLGLTTADFALPGSALSGGQVPAERLLGLSARRAQTGAGRARVDLLVLAEAGTRKAVLAASSYDGLAFAVQALPLLARTIGQPGTSTVLTYRQRALLLTGLKGAQTGIAAARIP
jgi:hypothetical protein